MNESDLKEAVKRIRWWHAMDLGHGVVTPGADNTQKKLTTLKLPDSLEGVSVLDVGAWDGFFSFEAERRGAKRVLATDWFCWVGPGWGTRAGFDLARKVLDSKVEDQEIDVLEISPHRVGVFDLVLFLGVLYHMRHPLLALEKVASVTAKQLILETHVSMLSVRQPVMRFYPANELANDGSNWWGPNLAAVQAMLKDVGFNKMKIVYRTPLFEKLKYAVKCKTRDRGNHQRPFFEIIQEERVVIHAFK